MEIDHVILSIHPEYAYRLIWYPFRFGNVIYTFIFARVLIHLLQSQYALGGRKEQSSVKLTSYFMHR